MELVEPEANALHGEASTVQPNPRSISIEDNVLHQIDRIGYLRSIGEDWKEPVFHLRDLIVGLEDDEFWNGTPMHLRDKTIPQEHEAEYKDRGWKSINVRMRKRVVDGIEIEYLDPLPQELSKMLRIILALLARRNMTWRRRNVDEIPLTFGIKGVETEQRGGSV